MVKIYTFKTEVWLWPGVGGWHFVNVPVKTSEEIKKKYGKGMIKVSAKLGKTEWDTSLFPHKKSKGYLVCLKKDIRKKEGIYERDKISLAFKVI